MKRFIVSIGCITAFVLSTDIAVAQGRGSGGPKVKPTGGGGSKAGTMAQGGGSKAGTMAQGGGSKAGTMARGGKSTHGGGPKTTTQTAKTNHGATMKAAHGGGAKGPKTASNAGGPKTKSATTAASTTTTTPTDTTKTKKQTTTTASGETLSPVQQKLERNTNLASKLESRLPDGTNLMEAAEGFKSLGQFVSTVNASHNHDLDFDKLKIAILDDGMSLGQAMKDQRTSLDSTTAATTATREADIMIRTTDPVVTSGTTTSKSKPRPRDR